MIRPLADAPAISMCIQAICHRNIHLSKRAPRMNESRGSKRTKTKQKKEMNSQHSSSSDHSWPRHISAVSWTGHCDVFQNFKHTRDNFRGGGKIYQIFGKNKQTPILVALLYLNPLLSCHCGLFTQAVLSGQCSLNALCFASPSW